MDEEERMTDLEGHDNIREDTCNEFVSLILCFMSEDV